LSVDACQHSILVGLDWLWRPGDRLGARMNRTPPCGILWFKEIVTIGSHHADRRGTSLTAQTIGLAIQVSFALSQLRRFDLQHHGNIVRGFAPSACEPAHFRSTMPFILSLFSGIKSASILAKLTL
jgi:hypothetical protein